MADEEAPEAKVETNEDSSNGNSGGGKKKLIIIAIIALFLVGGGGVVAMFLLSGGDHAKKTEEEEVVEGETNTETSEDKKEKPGTEEKEDAKKEEDHGEGDKGQSGAKTTPEPKKEDDLGIEFGDTYAMKTFNLNLGNALENRFVRMEVTLEYTGGEKQKKEIEKRLPQLRDAVIAVVSRKTREFLLAPDGKDALRKEILIRINRYMKQKIEAVYITDILIE